jgi:hypothetical protein
VTRVFSFEPVTSSFYTATIRVSDGWLITSVIDQHQEGPYEHATSPARAVTDVLSPGPLTVTVADAADRATPGVLNIHFVDAYGNAVDGGGTFTL